MTAGGTGNPRAYELFVRGRGYLQRFDVPGNIDHAVEALSQAVTADPGYALAQTALSEAYWRSYKATGAARSLDRAAEHAEKALTLANRLAAVHVILAILARERGRFEQAVTYAQTAVDLDPVNSDAYRELASAYDRLQQPGEAEAAYRKAVAFRPDDWLAHNRLGVLLLNQRRWSEAEAQFRREMELVPDNAIPYNNLASTYSGMGRRDDAVAVWEKSMTIRPTSTAASNLASAYYSSGRYAEAVPAYQKALALGAGDYKIWGNLGSALHWSSGDRSAERDAYSKAVALAEEARRFNPRDAEALAGLADYCSILGRRAEALEAARGVERLQSRDPQVLYTVANAYEQMGDRNRALQWLGKALAAGYDRASIERSPWLESLRKDKRFVQMMRNPDLPPKQP